MCISSKQSCPINLLSDCIPDAIAISNSDTIHANIRTEDISEAIPNSNPEAIPVAIPKPILEAIPKSDSDHSHSSTLLHEDGLRLWRCEGVGEHLSSLYVAQVDLSISRPICSKIILGHNVFNCS